MVNLSVVSPATGPIVTAASGTVASSHLPCF